MFADVPRIEDTASSNQTVEISVAPRYITLTRNIEQVRFQCYINGRPAQEGQTMWMRGNRRIFCAKTNRIFACSNILIIQHVTVRDSGYYKCVSSSNNRSFYQASVMGRIFRKIFIIFHVDGLILVCRLVPASIIDSEGEIVRVNAAALESVQLKCHVRQDSFPKSVEVLWQYDDSYIAIGNTLQLRDIDQNKMGVYKCSASNGYGDPATKSFHLETTKVALDVEVQVADSMGCQSQPSCLVCTLTYLVTSITLYYGIF